MSMTIHAIGIEFIGTHYKGWQRQQEVDSIQARLEYAISKVANKTCGSHRRRSH